MKKIITLVFLTSCSTFQYQNSIIRKEIPLGVAVKVVELDNAAYKKAILDNFSSVTHENALKMSNVLVSKGKYDFEKADKLVDFAQKNGLSIRGHVLIWHRQYPKWLSNLSKKELTEVFDDYITTVVERYKGKFRSWDVVNEAINNNGEYRNSIWYRVFGQDYVERAFRLAKKVDPDVKLYYNDYYIEKPSKKYRAVYALLEKLKSKNVPIDGIGLQSHFNPKFHPEKKEFELVLDKLTALGLEIEITELDVAIADQSKESLSKQAETFFWVGDVCSKKTACKSITVWGLSDQHSWISRFFPGLGNATLLERQEVYKRKKTFKSLLRGLNH